MGTPTDFRPLGDWEIEDAGDVVAQCEFLRQTASNSGLIVAQWAYDLEDSFRAIRVFDPNDPGWGVFDDGDAHKRAERAAEPLHNIHEHLRSAAIEAGRWEKVYKRVYADLFDGPEQRARRRTFNPTGGL